MKILKSCCSFYYAAHNVLWQFKKASMTDILKVQFLEQLSNDILTLKGKLTLLREWNIPLELFGADVTFHEEQVAYYAKGLVMAVFECIYEKSEIGYGSYLAGTVDFILQQENKIINLFEFMEKYTQAASILLSAKEIGSDDRRFFELAFGLDEKSMAALTNKLKARQVVLYKVRNDFIQASVLWSRQQENESENALGLFSEENTYYVDIPLIPKNENPESELWAESKENENLQPEPQTESREKLQTELIEEVLFSESMEEGIENLNVFHDFGELYDMLDEELVPEERKETEEAFSVQAESVEQLDEEEAFIVEIDDIMRKEEMPVAEFSDSNSKSVMNMEFFSPGDGENKSSTKSENDESCPFKNHRNLNPRYEGYVKNLSRWENMIQNEESPQDSDYDEASRICLGLLYEGQFALARELADTFQEIWPDKCINPAVIHMIGSGLYIPATDLSAQTQFLASQPLAQMKRLSQFEQTASALAAIPIAHYYKDIKLDGGSAQVPEGICHWMQEIAERRKEITYLDSFAIEQYRLYQVRLKKIRSIQKEAAKQFKGMFNAKISFVAANRVLAVLCDKECCIGFLQDIMEKLNPEKLALGINDFGVRDLYDKGRRHIPERKSTAKTIDDNLINDVIDSGMKRLGYTTEIEGKNRSKMMQIIRNYLGLVNKWLEIIKVPCYYEANDSSAIFMKEMAEIYVGKREMLHEYASKNMKNEQLYPIILQLISVMDYITGETEVMPENCKADLQHAYRLCAVPSLYLRKNELGVYRYTCKNTLERLHFLQQVISSQSQPVAKCLDMFMKEDAFSECEILFEIMEDSEEITKARERYGESVKKRLGMVEQSIMKLKKSLYQISVYAGWLGNDYSSVLSKIAFIERMLKEEKQCDVSLLCAMEKSCKVNVESLLVSFRTILKEQVNRQQSGHMTDEQHRKLNALIDEGQYAAVIEWTAHTNITDKGIPEEDFFRDRYFEVYEQKESSLLKTKDVSMKLQGLVTNANSWGGFDFNKVPKSIGNNRAKLIAFWYRAKERLQISKTARIEDNDNFYNNPTMNIKSSTTFSPQ